LGWCLSKIGGFEGAWWLRAQRMRGCRGRLGAAGAAKSGAPGALGGCRCSDFGGAEGAWGLRDQGSPCGGPHFCGGALVVHTWLDCACVVRTCRVEAAGGFLARRSHAGPSNAGPAAPAGSRRSWGAGRGGSPRRRALTRLPRGASGELRHTRPPLRRPPRPAPRTLASRRVGKKVDERGSEPLERRVPVVASVGREGRAREGARGSFFPGRGFRIVLARGGGGAAAGGWKGLGFFVDLGRSVCSRTGGVSRR
jgi:hypothetical protein